MASDRRIARLFAEADLVSADGQPLVLASRLLCAEPLPERVATTDLFHDAARLASRRGASFYLLGASEEENRRAYHRIAKLYPDLRIVGRSHGYLEGEALARLVAEIDALAPDVLWVGLGVPREQIFCASFADALPHVGAIKTSGGLFNFLSATRKRAPGWMQSAGLEWMFRILQEPRRLLWRYALHQSARPPPSPYAVGVSHGARLGECGQTPRGPKSRPRAGAASMFSRCCARFCSRSPSLLAWVGVEPFTDLSDPALLGTTEAGNPLNQFAYLGIAGLLFAMAASLEPRASSASIGVRCSSSLWPGSPARSSPRATPPSPRGASSMRRS